MKRLLYIFMSLAWLVVGCSEDVDVVIPEDVDVANITGITVYNESLTTVSLKSTTIDRDAKTVLAAFNAEQDITRLKISLTISSGATVKNPLGTGFLDFSSPKTITIVSPSTKVESVWTITFANP